MDDMINRHDSIAEENIEPNGRPAKDQFEEWSGEVADRADEYFANQQVYFLPTGYRQLRHKPVFLHYGAYEVAGQISLLKSFPDES